MRHPGLKTGIRMPRKLVKDWRNRRVVSPLLEDVFWQAPTNAVLGPVAVETRVHEASPEALGYLASANRRPTLSSNGIGILICQTPMPSVSGD